MSRYMAMMLILAFGAFVLGVIFTVLVDIALW